MASVSEVQAMIAERDKIKVVDRDKIGFSGMTSEDFMKLLVTQLQNQDPSNPMDSDQLLNQVSQMRSLQANLELESALKGLTLSQQLSSASDLIGKTVTAVTGDQNVEVTGAVESVLVKDGKTLLRVDGQNIPMDDVTNISPEVEATSPPATTPSQRLSNATNLIGKTVTAVVKDENFRDVEVTGEVESVVVKEGRTLLRVDGREIPSGNVTQQVNGASNLIGKTVTALVGEQNVQVTGAVQSILVKDGKTLLRVNGQEILLEDVTDVESE